MQAELTQEQAIAVLGEISERGTLALSDQARLNMVRALLAGKVLCDADELTRYKALEHVQQDLPREAIAAAIPLLIAHGKELLAQRYEGAPGSIYRQLSDELIEKNRKHIEQLQALLPKEEV